MDRGRTGRDDGTDPREASFHRLHTDSGEADQMDRCVISTMFGSSFWFNKNFYLFKQPLVLPTSPWSFPFPTPVFYPVDPLARSFIFPTPVLYPVEPPPHLVLLVLHISHSGSLPCRPPLARSFAFLTPVFLFHFCIFVYLDASLKFGERRHTSFFFK